MLTSSIPSPEHHRPCSYRGFHLWRAKDGIHCLPQTEYGFCSSKLRFAPYSSSSSVQDECSFPASQGVRGQVVPPRGYQQAEATLPGDCP
ncbi:hypothetical protein RRG08_045382 [Elysia crispata]|uniref:Uncharacterized protein n=1 Tax=Elysia crispata TaxID=231223 RepID=A0AAE1CW29_9GAST|nr:hypothetical protein RRG08_045382 [Elysia crispata]